VKDPSPLVRARAVIALGTRRARSQAAVLRERAEDAEESLEVRVRAVYALGRVCDPTSLELLTVLARRAADPFGAPAAAEMGLGAIAGLGHLHPPDLDKRLEPVLSGPKTPRHVRGAAQAALRETDVCR
jgi:hypothetical protein